MYYLTVQMSDTLDAHISIKNNGSQLPSKVWLDMSPGFVFSTQSHFPDEDQLFGYEPSSVDGDEPASGKENHLIN